MISAFLGLVSNHLPRLGLDSKYLSLFGAGF